jgi:O-antigen ligase
LLGFYLNTYTIETDFLRIEMGLSYALLPLFVGSILHFIFFRKTANIFNKIAYLFNLYFFYLLIFFGTRGVVISIFLLFLLLVSLKVKDSTIQIRPFRAILIVLAVFFFFIKFQQILLFVQQMSITLSVNIAFAEKTLDLISTEGDLFNSRLLIYNIAIDGFLSKPFFGNGIGSFNMNTGIIYVHNIFLDLLYEGGLLLFIPITLILLGIFKNIFVPSNLNKSYYVFLLLLFISSVPRLLFSASFWSLQIFWLLIGFYISKKNREIV